MTDHAHACARIADHRTHECRCGRSWYPLTANSITPANPDGCGETR